MAELYVAFLWMLGGGVLLSLGPIGRALMSRIASRGINKHRWWASKFGVFALSSIAMCVVIFTIADILIHAFGFAEDGFFLSKSGLRSVAAFAFAFATGFLVLTVARQGIALVATENPDVLPFLGNVLLSGVHLIVAFAAVYVVAGLDDTDRAADYFEALYFSTVAFSTLGFGDVVPSVGISRLFAAVEAVLGNLHLAFFTAAGFFLISSTKG